MRFVGIPTSERTAAQAAAADIPLSSFGEHGHIDLTIDGADEVERGTLNLIKGLGGVLLREKIVAAASRRLAIIVDGTKLVNRLGTRAPVPVEVVAFGLEATRATLEVLGASARPRLSPAGEPFVTDSGHPILDCDFGPIAVFLANQNWSQQNIGFVLTAAAGALIIALWPSFPLVLAALLLEGITGRPGVVRAIESSGPCLRGPNLVSCFF